MHRHAQAHNRCVAISELAQACAAFCKAELHRALVVSVAIRYVHIAQIHSCNITVSSGLHRSNQLLLAALTSLSDCVLI